MTDGLDWTVLEAVRQGSQAIAEEMRHDLMRSARVVFASATPCRRNPSSAPSSKRSTTTALKRAAMIANRPWGVKRSPS